MNGKSLDAAAAADASEEVIAVVAATPKPAEKEGEKKQPAKKQPKKKKEPKAQQQKKKEPKEPAQQGAPAEKSNRRKRANKKAPAAKRAVPTFQVRLLAENFLSRNLPTHLQSKPKNASLSLLRLAGSNEELRFRSRSQVSIQ